MKSTDYKGYRGFRLPKATQLARVREVMERELSPRQQRAIRGFYLEGKTITRMAAEDGVNKSSICRLLHRGEERLRKYLRY